MIIGIVGPIASGKSVLSEILIAGGFIRFSLSDEVREEAREQKIPIERKHLQDLGNLMREKFGKGYWMQRIIKKMQEDKNYIIDGIRNPGEIEELEKLKDFILIGVNAPLEKRFEWIITRNKDSDPKTLDGVKVIDARDRGKGEEKHGQQVDKCYSLADYYIENDGSLDDSYKKCEKLIEELKII